MNYKHKFLQPNALYNEIKQCYISNSKLIIAYDFDNTIHPSGKITAEEGEEVIDLLKRWAPYASFICYTSNVDLMKVYKFIIKNDIPCDAINENPPEVLRLYAHYGYLKETRKPYANIYLDDKSGLYEAFSALEKLISEIEQDVV